MCFQLLQDLKDFMRKAGEVTYVDAHRGNRNEGYVLELCNLTYSEVYVFEFSLRFF